MALTTAESALLQRAAADAAAARAAAVDARVAARANGRTLAGMEPVVAAVAAALGAAGVALTGVLDGGKVDQP